MDAHRIDAIVRRRRPRRPAGSLLLTAPQLRELALAAAAAANHDHGLEHGLGPKKHTRRRLCEMGLLVLRTTRVRNAPSLRWHLTQAGRVMLDRENARMEGKSWAG